MEFAQHGNAPFTNTQVINTAYYIMAQAKVFKDTYKYWKRLPADLKIWPTFKTTFFQAYTEWKKENKYNADDYHNNNLSNYAKDTAEALQTMLQVNNATGEEQATQMANFTIQHEELRTQLENVTAQLATLQTTIQQLTANQDNSNTINRNGNDNRIKNHNPKRKK